MFHVIRLFILRCSIIYRGGFPESMLDLFFLNGIDSLSPLRLLSRITLLCNFHFALNYTWLSQDLSTCQVTRNEMYFTITSLGFVASKHEHRYSFPLAIHERISLGTRFRQLSQPLENTVVMENVTILTIY